MVVIKSERHHYGDVAADSSYIKTKLKRSDSLGPTDYVLPSPYPYEDSKLSCSGNDDWLNLALSRMRADQQDHLHLECKSKSVKPRVRKPKSSRPAKPKLPTSQAKSRVPSGKPPQQSLCATHPSQYNRTSLSGDSHRSETLMSSPHTTRYPAPPSHDMAPSLASHEVYFDPKRLAGFGEPAMTDPSPRMLKIDTQSAQTNIVSPMFMIPLPCGSLVEMAAVYGP